uniref:RRM domain-containing protein n=1 Tax=Zooxanthella nutricula TaxID=1333877 RepID=A0A7S2I7K6_9DINO
MASAVDMEPVDMEPPPAMVKARAMTWPLKLRLRTRSQLCECRTCQPLADGRLSSSGTVRPARCERTEASFDAADDTCQLGNLDIVSASTAVSPDSTTDRGGLPQHVAVDESYWSPESAPCDVPAWSEEEMAAMWEAHDPSMWGGFIEEEHFLPPGLLSPSGSGAAGSPPLGAASSPLFGPLAGPQLPPGLSQVWGASFAECMQFDQLAQCAYGGTGCLEPGPIGAAAAEMCDGMDEEDVPRTTVMIRNLPNCYSRQCLLTLLDTEGFAGMYDFVYLPIDFASAVNLGYAFIDLVTPDDALQFMDHFTGFSNWAVDSDKTCQVSWSSPHQGLEQHVERYRSSPVMHSSIPEDWKPLIFLNGVRVPFPPPTKHIKAPKVRGRPDTLAASVTAQAQQ